MNQLLTAAFARHLGALLLLSGAVLHTPVVQAQWQWLDSNGHKVFSDRPPPAGTPDDRVLQRPATTAPPQVKSATANTQAPASAPGTANRTTTRADVELDAKKKQAESADEAARKAEEARATQARADNCQRAQKHLATLNSGVRLGTVNARGEREFMDEANKAAELTRAQIVIQQSCGASRP